MAILLAMAGKILPLVDRLVPGGLGPKLAEWAGDDLSTEEMASRLATDFAVDVTRETVRMWLHHYGVSTKRMSGGEVA